MHGRLQSFRIFLFFAVGIIAPMSHAAEVLVSAAASLKDALTELAPLCANQTGVTLTLNLGASGLLARQIQAGAPTDIFISADDATMDQLAKAGLLQPGTRAPLLGNALVLVVPAGSPLKVEGPAALEQSAIRRIGVGDPKTVPAGHYAQLYLESAQVWPLIKDKLVPLDNVRTVLSAVAASNVDIGIVYKTDAAMDPHVAVAWAVPPSAGPAIHYPVAILKNTRSPAASAKVREFLLGAAARAVFARYGFILPPLSGVAAPGP